MIGQRGATRRDQVTRFRADEGEGRAAARSSDKDALAVEEPFEIRLSWGQGDDRRVEPLAVTMRTPGADFELAAGFLYGEGIVDRVEDVLELTYCSGPEEQEYNVVEVRLAPDVDVDMEALRRNFYTTSSCGVCGKASLEAVRATGCTVLAAGPSIEARLVAELPVRLRDHQSVFARTGGLHAAGVFDSRGAPAVVMEDVGRHNAVDKAVGRLFLNRLLPADRSVLVVSGRASFELVQKAVAAGIPVMVAVGAPSSLAVDLARSFRQTLVGFARDGGFNVYSGEERIG